MLRYGTRDLRRGDTETLLNGRREKTERGKGEWRRENGGGNSSREEYNEKQTGHVESKD